MIFVRKKRSLPTIELVAASPILLGTDGTVFTGDFTDFTGGLMVMGFWTVGSASPRSITSVKAVEASAAENDMTQIVAQGEGTQGVGALYRFDATGKTMSSAKVTMSGTCSRLAMAVWRLNGLASMTETDSAGATLTDPISANIDVSQGGIILGCAGQNASSMAATWTGLTERFDSNIEGTSALFTGAHDSEMAAEVNRAISVDFTGGTATFEKLLLASFR